MSESTDFSDSTIKPSRRPRLVTRRTRPDSKFHLNPHARGHKEKRSPRSLTRDSRERALTSRVHGTRVGFGMRYTCYNSPVAVITHNAASTVDTRVLGRSYLPIYCSRCARHDAPPTNSPYLDKTPRARFAYNNDSG